MGLLDWLKGKNSLITTTVKSEVHKTFRTDADRAIIEQLRKVGLDLTSPFPVRYIFSAPDGEKAREIAQELQARGFQSEVSEEGGRWKIAAPKDVVLTEDGMAVQRTEFTSLAGNYGGLYHGWEMEAKQTKVIKNVTRS